MGSQIRFSLFLEIFLIDFCHCAITSMLHAEMDCSITEAAATAVLAQISVQVYYQISYWLLAGLRSYGLEYPA
jgi:hypothetical protein